VTTSEENFIIGNPNPDFYQIQVTISYRGLNLSMLMSYTAGGDIYSQTIAAIQGRGLTADTEDRLNTFILPGVTATEQPNTTKSTIHRIISII
jgi:hypothetical protein